MTGASEAASVRNNARQVVALIRPRHDRIDHPVRELELGSVRSVGQRAS